MALTQEQQDLLAALEAQRDAAPPRTRTGLAGILHALIESAAGVVAHRSPQEWELLHTTAEEIAGARDDDEDQAAETGETAGTETSPEA